MNPVPQSCTMHYLCLQSLHSCKEQDIIVYNCLQELVKQLFSSTSNTFSFYIVEAINLETSSSKTRKVGA